MAEVTEVRREEGVYSYCAGHFRIECACGSAEGCHYDCSDLEETVGSSESFSRTI